MPKKKATQASSDLKIRVLKRPVVLNGVTYRKGDEFKCVRALAESLIERHYAELATGKAQPAPVLEEVEEPKGDE